VEAGDRLVMGWAEVRTAGAVAVAEALLLVAVSGSGLRVTVAEARYQPEAVVEAS
jgi:hypothetical protein